MRSDSQRTSAPTASKPAPGADAGAKDTKPRQPMYDDDEKLLELLKRCQQDARNNGARQARDRADLENLKMYRGGEANQWIVWDGNANTYVERPTEGEAGIPEWFFRATSNQLKTKIDGITAIENQSKPAKDWYATRDDDESRAAADVAEMADPVLLEEIDYPHSLRTRLNKLVALTHAAALVLTYDTDAKWGEEDLPLLLCQNPQCRAVVNPMDAPNGAGGEAPEDRCPECGGPLDFSADPRDPSGMTPLAMPYPKGKLDAELISSFELSLPKNAQTAHEEKNPWVATHQRWSTEDAISRWPTLKGILGTGRGSSGGSGAGANAAQGQAWADQMRSLSSPVGPGTYQNVAGSGVFTGPVIWRLWHDAIDDEDFYFPDGVFLTALEGEDLLLDKGPLPYKDDDQRPFKNVLIRQFACSPGSPWGSPPADDLTPLQKQLNLAQSLAFLILMHHASPRTFIPSTVTLHDKLTGMPGKDVGYRAQVPGEKPFTEPGQGFPDALKWFLEFIIGTFDQVSKLNAVLMGERPQGDPTLGEVEILQERGFAAFQEPLEQLTAFEQRLSLKLMWIARESAWAPRFRRLLGDNGDWELKQFTGADLGGHFTVDVDPLSAYPKSPLLINLRVSKAVELGFIVPQDPEVQEEYLRINDLQAFKQSTDTDHQQIARQLQVWRAAQAPQQIEPPQPWWRLDMHLFRKTEFLKTAAFEAIRAQNGVVAQAMVQHVLQLQQMLQPPAPAPAPGKGDQGALPAAVHSGALRPAGKPGSKGALPSAVRTGALQPAGTAAAAKAHARRQHGPSVGDLVRTGAMRPAQPKPKNTGHVPPSGGAPGGL